jgi:hypothetical protein
MFGISITKLIFTVSVVFVILLFFKKLSSSRNKSGLESNNKNFDYELIKCPDCGAYCKSLSAHEC